MKMKTERGRRKIGRRLGLPESDPKKGNRRVSLSRHVERNELAPPPEEAVRLPEEEASPSSADEQS